MNSNTRTVNAQQAAEFLGCSRSFIYKLFDQQKIAGYRLGNYKGLRLFLESVTKYRDDRISNAE